MCDFERGLIYGYKTYDWCFGGSRTPESHPYSYDAFYVWRDFDKDDMSGIGGEYSDRLQQWEPEKYAHARREAGMGAIENVTREQARKFIKAYYGGKYECVGYARCCNVSSGYGLGIFYIREVVKKRKKT